MAVTKVVIITVIGWACHLVAAQDKVCSAFCTSLGMLQSSPARSCDDIYQMNKQSRGVSGNYWINTTTGVHQVYCDMELECGGHKGGWMRIAALDASKGDDCPSEWTKITTPVASCIAPNTDEGCYSANFTTLSTSYSKVCGMAVGYQKGGTNAFAYSHSIDGPYVDGISITYGTPRKHIWTYAIGLGNGDNTHRSSSCPCAATTGGSPPSFVRDNYYCESGTVTTALPDVYYVDDPVWDGQDCPSDNSCCSQPSLPWFYHQLPRAASEDIEARLCRNEDSVYEDILVKEFQLYVQ